MTVTISEVQEIIKNLESSGKLSIKEEKYLKMAKLCVQMAAENVAMKSAITDHSHSVHFCEVCGKDDPCSTDDVCYALSETPATNRIVAGIKADGVEEWVSSRGGRWNGTTEEALIEVVNRRAAMLNGGKP